METIIFYPATTLEFLVIIAMNQVSLAAFAEDLGTCWIAAFKENEVKEILRKFCFPNSFLSPLGYPAENKVPITNEKSIDPLVRYVYISEPLQSASRMARFINRTYLK